MERGRERERELVERGRKSELVEREKERERENWKRGEGGREKIGRES